MQIDQAAFRNSFVEELRGEIRSEPAPPGPRVLLFAVAPTPVRDPRLLAWSDDLAACLGLERPPERGPAVDVLAGNLVTPTMKPFAARYGGHQFGSWAGQLGDGRAISLGELARATAPPGRSSSRGRARPRTPGRRRTGRPALVAAGIPLQRGDAPPRGPHDAGVEPGRDR